MFSFFFFFGGGGGGGGGGGLGEAAKVSEFIFGGKRGWGLYLVNIFYKVSKSK